MVLVSEEKLNSEASLVSSHSSLLLTHLLTIICFVCIEKSFSLILLFHFRLLTITRRKLENESAKEERITRQDQRRDMSERVSEWAKSRTELDTID